MATCAVSGFLLDPTGAPISSVQVFARVAAPFINSPNLIMPNEVSAVTSTNGSFTLTLQQSISVLFRVQFPPTGTEPLRTVNYVGNVPALSTANFTDILVIE